MTRPVDVVFYRQSKISLAQQSSLAGISIRTEADFPLLRDDGFEPSFVSLLFISCVLFRIARRYGETMTKDSDLDDHANCGDAIKALWDL